MQSFIIHGGKPLYGSVRLGGAKNASFKLMIASLLAPGESRLLNFSHIKDVEITRHMLEGLGANTKTAGERTMFISSLGLRTHIVDAEHAKHSRASTMFLGPLLAKFGKAEVPMPGGDAIGKRPLERHLDGLKALGVTLGQTDHSIIAEAPKGLKGAKYKFTKNSHTGTETLIMAAVLAKGKTVLENAATEPEVDDLIDFLNNMGARIHRKSGRVIVIEGVQQLHPTIHRVMPDRNEAVSYACAAIATGGDIVVENARKPHLLAFLKVLEELGAGYEVGSYGIRFYNKGPMKGVEVTTQPHPGFMTDWQPLLAVLLTQAEGRSVIHEAVSESRFQYAESLAKMGVDLRIFQPEVKQPEKLYNFNIVDGKVHGEHALEIHGKAKLQGGEYDIVDLRAGATLTLASLVAHGTSRIHHIEHIDRGYEEFDKRLRSMGAEIVRVDRTELPLTQ